MELTLDTRPTVRVTLAEGAVLPEYQTAGSSGMDLRSTCPIELAPMERRLVPTGVRIELPEGYEGQVRPRSGLALKKGVTILNAPGTIDSDYRGEIGVILINLSSEPVKLDQGERIAQLVIVPVTHVRLEQVEELGETERGEGGFGSTGVK